MKRILLSLGLSLVCVGAFAQLSGTYTIDAGSPSSATNFQTFSDAFDELTTNGVSGPVTINVIEGTYSEQLNYSNATIDGTSATNTVTVQSDAGNANMPLLQFSSYPVRFYYCDFANLTIKGIHFNSTSSTSSVLYIYYGSYTNVNWEDNKIEGAVTTSTSTSYAAVYHYRVTNVGHRWINNEVTDGSYGYYIYYNYGTSGEEGLLLDGNEIIGAEEAAIYQYYSYSCRMEFINNTLHTSAGTNECYGFYSYYMPPGSRFDNNTVTIENTYTSNSSSYELYATYIYYPGDDVDGILPDGNVSISNNRIHVMNDPLNYHHGLRVYYPRGTFGNRIRVANNMVSNENNSTYISYGAYIYYAAYTDVINNSIYWQSTYTSGYGMYYYTGSSSTLYGSCTMLNNIIQTTSASPYTVYVRQYVDFTAGYNLFWNGSAMKNYWYTPNGGIYYDLNSFEAGSGTSNNFAFDPEYISAPNDLHIFNEPLNGSGTDVGLDHDIDGDFRLVTNPDVGADEFGVANDAAPTAFLNPVTPLCGDSCVRVVFANAGSNNLTSLDIVFTMNGGVPVTEQWTGNLPTGGTDTLLFGCNFSFQDGDSISIYTTLPNGQYDSLNTFDTMSVVTYFGLAGTYTIPGSFATLTDAVDAANARGVCEAVIMNIAPGVYNEQLLLRDVNGVSSSKTITWRSATGNAEDVEIEFTGTSTNFNVVTLNGTDWQIFEDLTIRNTSPSYAHTVELNSEANNNILQNSILEGVYSSSSSVNYYNVYLNGPNYNNRIVDNHIIAGGVSIAATGSSADYNCEFGNNLIDDWGYYGIYNYYYGGTDIHDNRIINDTNNLSCYMGIYNYYSPLTDIDRNYINAPFSSYGIGYGMYNYLSPGTSNDRVSYSNNCVSVGKPDYTGYGYYGMYVYGGYIDIAGNTITKGGGSTSTNYTSLYLNTGGSVTLENNSLVNYASPYAYYSSSEYTIVGSDYNNLYTTNGALVYNANIYNDLASYQTGTGFDLNSMEVDPVFADTAYCATCSEDLDGAGNPANMFADVDVKGATRSATTPDIGAVEFLVAEGFDLGPDSVYCQDELVINASPETNLTWSVNGNASTDPVLTLEGGSEAITYNVLINLETEFCGSKSDQAIITLVPNAHLDSNVHLCVGDDAVLHPGGLSTGSYSWSTGETTQAIIVDAPGVFTVTKNVMGCESSATSLVTQSDEVVFPTTDACSDALPLELDATIYNGISYAWTGGTSPTASVNYFNDGGPYSVTATDSYGCSSTVDFVVNVLDAPQAVITVPNSSGTIYQFDASTSIYLTSTSTVNWSFGAMAVPTTSTSVMETVTFPWSNPSSPTSYPVFLEVNNGCGIDDATMIVTPDPLGTEEVESDVFAMFPNPATEEVTINTSLVSNGVITILDMSGRTVLQTAVDAGSQTQIVNVSQLSSGSYMVRVSGDESSQIRPLIVQ